MWNVALKMWNYIRERYTAETMQVRMGAYV